MMLSFLCVKFIIIVGTTSIPSIGSTTTIPSILGTTTIPSIGCTTFITNIGGTTSNPSIGGTTTIPSIGCTTFIANIGGTTPIPSIDSTPSNPSISGTTTIPSIGGTTFITSICGTTTIPSIGCTTSNPTISGTTTIPSIGGTTAIPSISSVYHPTLEILMAKILALKEGLSHMMADLPEFIVQAIKTRFSTILDSDAALLAAVTLPKFKLRWLRDETRKDIIKMTLAALCHALTIKIPQKEPLHSPESDHENDYFAFPEEENQHDKQAIQTTVDMEICEYLKYLFPQDFEDLPENQHSKTFQCIS
ncbi:zinc finger BED domain-containing 1-like protein [Labeo rohita]|uniref:Zinc finger BED domain-containing 1-like protein n=1 Tax=Labeo rohita TaxID=84645 RepID=A0A498N1U2_LABRO|nr:zinc finger BED domain-containing 1-like protein [Labeo rohita]